MLTWAISLTSYNSTYTIAYSPTRKQALSCEEPGPGHRAELELAFQAVWIRGMSVPLEVPIGARSGLLPRGGGSKRSFGEKDFWVQPWHLSRSPTQRRPEQEHRLARNSTASISEGQHWRQNLSLIKRLRCQTKGLGPVIDVKHESNILGCRFLS